MPPTRQKSVSFDGPSVYFPLQPPLDRKLDPFEKQGYLYSMNSGTMPWNRLIKYELISRCSAVVKRFPTSECRNSQPSYQHDPLNWSEEGPVGLSILYWQFPKGSPQSSPRMFFVHQRPRWVIKLKAGNVQTSPLTNSICYGEWRELVCSS